MANATDLYETLLVTPSPDLVKPWLVASLELPDHRDATSMHLLALSARHENAAAFLDTLGFEAWSTSFKDEAMEIFRAAIVAGSQTEMTHMLLGYMLVRQDNAEGVPLLERTLADTADWPLPRRALAGWYVTRDPARALVVLASATRGAELDLRSMANEALGRYADADRP